MKTLAAVGAATLAGTLLAATPASAETDADTRASLRVDWTQCTTVDGDPIEGVDCGTIEVPLDYSDPYGEQIEIGLARRQAENPDERLGSILMDPGGPGGSGVASVKSYNPLSPEAAERFDIIGFDPRGVNTSTQVLCGVEAIERVGALGVPTDQASFEELAAANAALTEDCRERTGPLFDHVDNLHTVEDMERIRLALGEGKLNFIGYSYGTLMGQQYAEAYPDKIRTMVLDGNMDHSLESLWEFMATETAAIEENFLEFTSWCEGATECALHGEDVPAVYGELKDAARAGDLTDPYTGAPLDFYGLSDYAFNASFPQFWPQLAELLQAAHAGETVPTATARVLQQQEDDFEHLYYPAWCQDWGFEVADYAEFEELNGKLAAEYPNVEWTSYNAHALTCVGSDIEHTNPRGELDIEGAPPIVFIGNVHDYATVYPWSVTAAEQAGGHLVTYEGYSHTVYSGVTPCIDEAVDAYLLDLEVPADGLSCENQDFPDVAALSGAPGAEHPVGRF